MSTAASKVAEAFSSHRFSQVYPHLADDVRWRNVGGDDIIGRDLVVAKCEESAQYLSSVTTTFAQLETIPAGDYVVVQSEATYTDGGGDESRVASCDVYQFAGDMLVAITSYNVELTDSNVR